MALNKVKCDRPGLKVLQQVLQKFSIVESLVPYVTHYSMLGVYFDAIAVLVITPKKLWRTLFLLTSL